MNRIQFFILCVYFTTYLIITTTTTVVQSQTTSTNEVIPLQKGDCSDQNGFPMSPRRIAPFTKRWVAPPLLNATASYCDEEGRCIDFYEVSAASHSVQVFPTGAATVFRSYNKVLSGPTIRTCKGRQSILRVNNNLDRNITVHNHGQASTAAYDGWAEDMIRPGYYKDYHYPNNEATLGWYHDHTVHLSALNAYQGLAAQYTVVDCLNPVEPVIHPKFTLDMTIADRVFDANNQLLLDEEGKHEDDLYGDHNLVNGIPFPFLEVEPRKYRFRLLNAALTRAFKIRLTNNQPFVVLGSEHGFAERPITVRALRVSASERYDIVIDFSGKQGQNITLLNDELKRAPMFCQSHLIAQFRVVLPRGTEPDLTIPARLYPQGDFPQKDRVVDQARIAEALAKRTPYELQFGRHNGKWAINSKFWSDAATRVEFKVKPNELFPLYLANNAGGWYHPIHVHLIDFIIVKRYNPSDSWSATANATTGLESYESAVAKDSVILGPNEQALVIARFGPHIGRYMFHCHNLLHEDNDMMLAFSVEGENSADLPAIPKSPQNSTLANPIAVVPTPISKKTPVNQCLLKAALNEGGYHIFYPAGQKNAPNRVVNRGNIWEVQYTAPGLSKCCISGPPAPAC